MPRKKSIPKTVIDHENFTLTLPGRWTETVDPDKTKLVYLNKDESEQLTISIFPLEDLYSVEMRKSRMENLVHGLQEIDKNASFHGPTHFREIGGLLFTRYMGYDDPSKRKYIDMAVCSPEFIINLYYEIVGEPYINEFDNKARTILDSFSVR